MTFRRWELISVPFPYVEGYEAKRRPALVISTDVFHAAHNACFAAMVTTARHMQDVRKDDIAITEWAKAGLPAPCVVRMARLSTFEAAPAIRRIGALAPVDRRAVGALIRRWFASVSATGASRRAGGNDELSRRRRQRPASARVGRAAAD